MGIRMPDGSEWVPDAKTIRWLTGVIDDRKLRDVIRFDVANRAPGAAADSDEFWSVVAESAAEMIVYNIADVARSWGTVFPDDPPTAPAG
jgi:hypothetical protein